MKRLAFKLLKENIGKLLISGQRENFLNKSLKHNHELKKKKQTANIGDFRISPQSLYNIKRQGTHQKEILAILIIDKNKYSNIGTLIS